MSEGQNTSHFRAKVARWVQDDPDPVTQAQLTTLLSRDDDGELHRMFYPPLRFGTAGLRGVIGPGPARMNLATVARVTAGLGEYLKAHHEDAETRGVVVARDGRNMSEEFAAITAEILAGMGIKVHVFQEPTPTPVAAFAVRHLKAVAGVVVTASHNPPEYNGYKVYSSRGCQIISPMDVAICDAADQISPIASMPRMSQESGRDAGLWCQLDDSIEEAYLEAIDAQCQRPPHARHELPIVTTALHGVGARWIAKALQRRGFCNVWPVKEQAEPDGRFPTVRFPNPEEDGALDMALDLARSRNAAIIVANDPDVDRLCVAVKSDDAEGGYRVLTGNELGILLADWILREGRDRGAVSKGGFVVTTVVSTMLLKHLATYYGAQCIETLTGFKWIWKEALAGEGRGGHFLFGFEEALGYCVGPAVRDKDGIGAALMALEMAAALSDQGQSLLDRLDDIHQRFGVHMSAQVATVLPGESGRARIQSLMEDLRTNPPKHIAGIGIRSTSDLSSEEGTLAGLPPSNVLIFRLENGSRVVFRPSGTEPKLKTYLEVCVRSKEVDAGFGSASTVARSRLGWLRHWVEGVVNG